MPYEVLIEKKAEKDFKNISKINHKRIIAAILTLKDNPRSVDVRKISGSENYYRVRAGDYRIIYEIDDNKKKVIIFRIRHRREVYENL